MSMPQSITTHSNISVPELLINAATAVVEFVVKVGKFLMSLVRKITFAQRDYGRAGLLNIYRLRQNWKRGDIKNLETYPLLNTFAKRRIAKLKNLPTAGRPAIKPFATWTELLVRLINDAGLVIDPTAPRHLRLRVLKKSIWWRDYVYAFHQSEYLRRKGTENPCRTADEIVGKELHLSSGTVKRLRLDYEKINGKFTSTAFSLSDYQQWLKVGMGFSKRRSASES